MNYKSRIATIAIITATMFATTGCVFTPMSAPTPTSAPASTTETTTQEQAAQPVTAEDRYMEAVMDGIIYESVPSNVEDMIIEMGYLTCQAWDEGATRSTLIAVVDSGLGDSRGFTPDAAMIFVDAALTHLC